MNVYHLQLPANIACSYEENVSLLALGMLMFQDVLKFLGRNGVVASSQWQFHSRVLIFPPRQLAIYQLDGPS